MKDAPFAYQGKGSIKGIPGLKRIRESRLFWPLATWALILVFDAIFIPGFFKIGIQDGHLYG
ncbi:MAG TPA: hypothetical protein VFT30_04370, partial [Nitrospira sp.]|nr:hypothetical protein [Nitrospira sp.]